MSRKNSLAKFWSLGLMVCGISMLGCSENNSNQTLPSSDSSQAPKLSADLVYNDASMKPVDSGIQKRLFLPLQIPFIILDLYKKGEIVSHDFEFTNTGSKDLLIASAKASCGCTVPQFPKAPIHPGEKSSIQVSFNSTGKRGYNEKSVVIQSNAEPAEQEIYIQAEVR
ncbi:MAG: DUF1573 domain-containing protein [Bacteroidetes bacterium]|nr:DUF1573 domain-containing protein [Bacteroidota bacterium]